MIQNSVIAQAIGESANLVLSGPSSGGSDVPRYRSLVVADIPSGIKFSTLSGAISSAKVPNGVKNFNTTQQALTTTILTYVTNSNLNVSTFAVNGIVVGTAFKWRIVFSKTATGTGAFNIVIFMGTGANTSDTAEVTQSIGTQTAVADTVFIDIIVVFTAVGSSTGSFYWAIAPQQDAATATGFGVATGPTGTFSGTVGSLNTTSGNLKLGIGFQSPTGAPNLNIPIVQAEAFNLV